MTRQRGLLLLTAIGVVFLAAWMNQKKPEPAGKLLVLEWAGKSTLPKPPVAVLIEFGLKDVEYKDWSGKATVNGAKVVYREGYRFRPTEGDKLLDPDAWEAKSHRPMRAPRNNPAVAKMETAATVGIVLHLADVKADASITIDAKDGKREKATFNLAGVLNGKPEPLWNGLGVARLISTATPVATERKTENDFPAACYGPDGTLWVAYVGYHIQDESRRIEQHNLTEQPKDFKFLYDPGFHDQVFVKRLGDGKWGQRVAVTDERQDIVGCAVGVERTGLLSVDLGARAGDSVRATTKRVGNDGIFRQADQVLEKDRMMAMRPSACVANDQVVYGFFQFSNPTELSDPRSYWPRDCTAHLNGGTVVVSEYVNDGDYDVRVALESSTKAVAYEIASSSRYEARPSVVCDSQGRLWIAFEEGPELWGKDYGALDDNDGNPLYSSRSVRVVCLMPDGKLMKPVAELPTSDVKPPKLPFGNQGPAFERNSNRYAYPKIGIDGKGRVWVAYRQKFGTRTSSHPGSYWLTFARRLDGDKWTEPIELHHSCGLLDHRPVLLPHKDGGLIVIHNTDGRYTTPEDIHNQIWMSHVDLPGEVVEPKLVAHDPGKKDPKLVERAKREQESVQRIRDYRIDHNGAKLRLLRGEFHRHTEISWDGGPDGSLEDMFRYAIDAAQMDWIGNGDHDAGAGREYSWWLIQKFTDAYTVPGRFTGMFTYERSVAYPHGHRNCMFAQRGVRTLPRLAAKDDKERVAAVHADDTKMLYRYLKEFKGICASHTSATSMGTDWRDNDPEVEPVVEIYQGDRMSYEMQAAPRAGYDPKGKQEPANIAGWFPDGFIDNALGKKGYKLGFQASSDHWSTHISYCVVLAEKNDRESILGAIRKRHTYGATDDIICDVRCDRHIMGDAFDLMGAPKFDIRIVGTSKLAKVDILKDSKVVATLKGDGPRMETSWTDPEPSDGTHYYYVRVLQEDNEIAWTSPMWVTLKK